MTNSCRRDPRFVITDVLFKKVALEASSRDNTQEISEVSHVPALSGRQHTKVPERFKPV
jgi:hypothetical protein